MSNSVEPNGPHRVLLLGLVALLGILIAWQFLRYRTVEKSSGLYLANGGRYLIVLDRGFGSSLNWTEGRFRSTEAYTGLPDSVRLSASLHRGSLRLLQSERDRNSNNRVAAQMDLSLTFQPSAIHPGDWDLVDGNFAIYTDSPSQAEGWRNLLTRMIRKFHITWGEPDIQRRFDKTQPAIPSYLHRVDDPRMVDYFHQRADGNFTSADLESFRAIFESHPLDPILQIHAIDVEAQYGDLEKAISLMAKWREEHWEGADPLLRETAEIAFKSVAHAQGLPSGDDLSEVNAVFMDTKFDLRERLRAIREFLKYEIVIGETNPLVPANPAVAPPSPTPKFFDFQINARVVRTIAGLQLFQGRNLESFETLAGLYNQGQMMNSDGWAIQRLIGIAIRLIADAGLELCILNAVHTEEEALHCIQILNQLHHLKGKETGETLFRDEWLAPICLMNAVAGSIMPDTLEVEIRHHIGEVRLELLRAVAAAKLHLIRTGEFPRETGLLAESLGTEFPRDVFGPGTLSMVQSETDTLTLYSYGPDEIDAQGSIQYSPTNGTKSVGDIFIDVPLKRVYPFPAEGVKADSATQVLEAFPNGLPQDLFAVGSRRAGDLSFRIYDRSGLHPVRIFSLGPDGIEPQSYRGLAYYEMPGMIPLDPDEPSSRARQPVYSPPTQPDGSPVLNDPLIPYEPTNGVKSAGELFVELPGK